MAIKDVKIYSALPAVARTTTATGSAVDLAGSLSGVENVKAFLDVGAITTAGTLTVKIQHSDTTTSADFTDISGATFTAVTSSTGTQEIHFYTAKRYVRAVGTFAGSDGYTFAVSLAAKQRSI